MSINKNCSFSIFNVIILYYYNIKYKYIKNLKY